jgi:hypothetical protein
MRPSWYEPTKRVKIFLARGPHLDWPAHVLIPWTEQYNNVALGILVFPFLDGTVRFSGAATVTAARLWGLIDNQWLTFFFLPLGSYLFWHTWEF